MFDYRIIKGVFTRELFEIYFLLGMKRFAITMVGLFLPLYIYHELGYSFNQTIYFFLMFILFFTIFLYPAVKLVGWKGAKHSMILSIPIIFLGLLFGILLQDNPLLFYPTAAFLGMEAVFFWIGFHIDAAVQGKKRKTGKEAGIINFVNIFPDIIGPLLGGLILFYFSFTVLFILALVIVLISVIPMLFSKEVYTKTDFDLKYFFKENHLKYFFAFFAQGIRGMTFAVFWPLFIFTILGNYISLGIYGSFATIFVCIFALLLGDYSDKSRRGFLIKISALFDGIFWVFKIFITSVIQIFALGTLGGIAFMGISVPLLSKTYDRAKKEKVAGFILFRELAIMSGQFTVLFAVLFVGKLELSFALTAVTSLLYLFF